MGNFPLPLPVRVVEDISKQKWSGAAEFVFGPYDAVVPAGPPPPPPPPDWVIAAPVPNETFFGQLLTELQVDRESGELLTILLTGPSTEFWANQYMPEVELLALLEFASSGQAGVTAVVDILNGMALTLLARTLKVSVFARVFSGYGPQPPPAPAGTAGFLPATVPWGPGWPPPGTLVPSDVARTTIQCSVVRGARGVSTAQRTVHSDDQVAVAAFSTIFPLTGFPNQYGLQQLAGPAPMPPAPAIRTLFRTVTFARTFRLNIQPQAAVANLVFFNTGGILRTYLVAPHLTEELDIPGSATGWYLYNIGTVPITRFDMTYYLHF